MVFLKGDVWHLKCLRLLVLLRFDYVPQSGVVGGYWETHKEDGIWPTLVRGLYVLPADVLVHTFVAVICGY